MDSVAYLFSSKKIRQTETVLLQPLGSPGILYPPHTLNSITTLLPSSDVTSLSPCEPRVFLQNSTFWMTTVF